MVLPIAFLLLVMSGCGGPPASQAPQSEAPASPPASTPTNDPPAAEPATEEPETKPEGIGIVACDEYLALYEKCEPKLTPEIQAGNRRTHRAEKGWLVMMKTQPDGANLESACRSMLAELEKSCL